MNSVPAITCEGRLENLAALVEFAVQASAAAGLGPDDVFAVRLAVEEVCTNVIAHGYRGGSAAPLTVRVGRRPDALVIAIEDRAPLFDPADAPPPALDASWDTRPMGGVGWHLVRQVMDEVHHEPAAPGGNLVTLVKYLPDGTGVKP